MRVSGKRLCRAAVLAVPAVELLFLSGAALGESAREPGQNPGGDWVQLWETRRCQACGAEGEFWVIFVPDTAETHQYMTMCLTCGAINGDLPPDDERHWNNVYRTESHEFAVERTEPTVEAEGRAVYTCGRCGYGYEEVLPRLEPTPEPTSEPTPGPTPGPTPEPVPEPTPGPTPGPTPEPTPEPTPGPTPGPTPEPVPEPTPGPTPEPTSEPTPELTPDPMPKPTPEPTSEPTPRPTPEPALLEPYVEGTGGGFAPDRPATRAEAAAMLARLLAQARGEAVPGGEPAFRDVDTGAWYFDAVSYLARERVLLGRGDGVFDPEAAVTRPELNALIARFLAACGRGEFPWEDAPGSGLVTRAETVAVLNRVTGRVPEREWIDSRLDGLRTFPDVSPGSRDFYEIVTAANPYCRRP